MDADRGKRRAPGQADPAAERPDAASPRPAVSRRVHRHARRRRQDPRGEQHQDRPRDLPQERPHHQHRRQAQEGSGADASGGEQGQVRPQRSGDCRDRPPRPAVQEEARRGRLHGQEPQQGRRRGHDTAGGEAQAHRRRPHRGRQRTSQAGEDGAAQGSPPQARDPHVGSGGRTRAQGEQGEGGGQEEEEERGLREG